LIGYLHIIYVLLKWEKTNSANRIITDSLGIGKAESSIKTECILEGELAVYSELVSRHYR
jgi:hypothetical protein